MGDGKVALILDVLGLAQQASVITGERDHPTTPLQPAIDGVNRKGNPS